VIRNHAVNDRATSERRGEGRREHALKANARAERWAASLDLNEHRDRNCVRCLPEPDDGPRRKPRGARPRRPPEAQPVAAHAHEMPRNALHRRAQRSSPGGSRSSHNNRDHCHERHRDTNTTRDQTHAPTDPLLAVHQCFIHVLPIPSRVRPRPPYHGWSTTRARGVTKRWAGRNRPGCLTRVITANNEFVHELHDEDFVALVASWLGSQSCPPTAAAAGGLVVSA
jgi:hypothetical protein